MLILKLKQVLSFTAPEEKPYDFEGRKGVSVKAVVTGLDEIGRVVVLSVKAKDVPGCQTLIDSYKLKVGQPADIPVDIAAVGGVCQLDSPIRPARRN